SMLRAECYAHSDLRFATRYVESRKPVQTHRHQNGGGECEEAGELRQHSILCDRSVDKPRLCRYAPDSHEWTFALRLFPKKINHLLWITRRPQSDVRIT